ncbi:hypothetical protein [Hyphomicrobium facile]|uniref:Uncharacterized protein n=1 Tax=Hyphomicrobium facile TaxID=51670 RepID=A0A1I7N2F3_9HYPH|nr:hypothetical protein [Hyphomicrobium facile]SFV28851.1 hypothetical protein SAMN04488557_1109 [Hyphomicrobium facile]
MRWNWRLMAGAALIVMFAAPAAQAETAASAARAARAKNYQHRNLYPAYPAERFSGQHETWRGGDRDFEYRRARRHAAERGYR